MVFRPGTAPPSPIVTGAGRIYANSMPPTATTLRERGVPSHSYARNNNAFGAVATAEDLTTQPLEDEGLPFDPVAVMASWDESQEIFSLADGGDGNAGLTAVGMYQADAGDDDRIMLGPEELSNLDPPPSPESSQSESSIENKEEREGTWVAKSTLEMQPGPLPFDTAGLATHISSFFLTAQISTRDPQLCMPVWDCLAESEDARRKTQGIHSFASRYQGLLGCRPVGLPLSENVSAMKEDNGISKEAGATEVNTTKTGPPGSGPALMIKQEPEESSAASNPTLTTETAVDSSNKSWSVAQSVEVEKLPLYKGQRVQALDFVGAWYPARISAINSSDRLFKVNSRTMIIQVKRRWWVREARPGTLFLSSVLLLPSRLIHHLMVRVLSGAL